MARYAPLITIAAVAALGGGMVFANTQQAAPAATNAAAPAAQEAAGEPAAAPPAPPAGSAPAAPAIAERVYAGRSAGNEVTVAIAVKDGRAVGYVCDGEKVESWLEGTLSGDALTLSSAEDADDTAAVTATVTEGASLGAVTVDGKEWPFSAQGVEAPAGLYEGRADVRDVATRIGWIVDGDGNVTGVANAGGQRRPAPALDPTDPEGVTLGGAPVEVSPLDGADSVIRR